MKICIDGVVAEIRSDTGIGVYTYEIIKGMYEDENINNHEYYVLITNEESFSEFKDNKNIHFIKLNEYSKECIINALKENKIELYHMPRNAMPYIDEKVCKYVVTIHDLIPIVMPDVIRKGAMKDFLLDVPKGIYYSDKIITVSEYSKRDIIRYFKVPDEKVTVTHLAPEDIYYEEKDNGIQNFQELKNKYELPNEYIFYIGGFNKRKNVHMLIDVFYEMIKEDKIDKSLNLVIAGNTSFSGMYLMELVEKYKIEDRVKFIGRVLKEDLPCLYQNAHLFIYPSLYEGFGLPPLEALAKDSLVLTSNVTSIPEVLKESVIYFNPLSKEDIICKLEPLVKDLTLGKNKIKEEKILKSNSRREVLNELSFKNTWKNTLEVYESLNN